MHGTKNGTYVEIGYTSGEVYLPVAVLDPVPGRLDIKVSHVDCCRPWATGACLQRASARRTGCEKGDTAFRGDDTITLLQSITLSAAAGTG
jgi:hypothetical protein